MLRLSLALLVILPGLAAAQPERYELGQRLKDFELAWEKHEDTAARKRALKELPKLTQQFFSLQLGEAGRTLDLARWKLESNDEPSDAEKWLTSLYAMPEKMLYTTKDKRITVNIKHFYKVKMEMPAGAKVWIGFPGEARVEWALTKLPKEITVPLPSKNNLLGAAGDYYLQMEFVSDSGASFPRQVMVSVVELRPRRPEGELLFPFLYNSLTPDRNPSPLYDATRKDYNERLKSLSEGEIPETNLPANRLIDLDNWMKGTIVEFPGEQVYLSIPVLKNRSIPIRMYIPTKPSLQKLGVKRPVVIALHGAGGSENLFFEGYGNGHIVKECEKRGWYLIAPRSPISFTGNGPPVKEILETLEKHFPIDRDEVFLVGHSMGAGQAIALAQANPSWYRGVAALGGGGRVSDAKAFGKLPIFIGVGDQDFALGGAKALTKSLEGMKVTYKEYPDLEHLTIVREALPDVFKQWDENLEKRSKRVTN